MIMWRNLEDPSFSTFARVFSILVRPGTGHTCRRCASRAAQPLAWCHRGALCTVAQIMTTIFVSSVNFIVESIPEVGGGPESVPWFIELVEWVRHAE